jgi:hypothetical protein
MQFPCQSPTLSSLDEIALARLSIRKYISILQFSYSQFGSTRNKDID